MYYQCIIATNGVQTFAMYIYPTGGMKLEIRQRRRIYMGYNALYRPDPAKYRFNYYKTLTPGPDNLDTDSSNTGD